ncbi:MAG TPA: hypothetical protein VMT32_06700 [Bryobacteraceae bacterium]|nr:hypothetical protein [Bryobacteraceae bacterium]
MKIEDPNLTAASIATTPATAPGSAKGSTSERPGTDDRVELSGFAGRLGSTLRADAQARSQRIAALARNYQSGSLRWDSRQTSRAIVNESLSSGAGEPAGQTGT